MREERIAGNKYNGHGPRAVGLFRLHQMAKSMKISAGRNTGGNYCKVGREQVENEGGTNTPVRIHLLW